MTPDSVKSFIKNYVLEAVPFVVALLTIIVTVFALVTSQRWATVSTEFTELTMIRIDTLERRIDSLEQILDSKLNTIENLQSEISKKLDNVEITENISIISELEVVKQEVSRLNKRITIFEIAIVDDPEKAMSIPLLRQELGVLSERLESLLESTKTEIDRVYEYSRWFLALMGTMAVGIMGLAVSNFFRRAT